MSERSDAIEDFSESLRKDCKRHGAWHNRAIARSETGDLDGAIKDLSRAIHLDPDFVDSWTLRARCRMQKGDFKGAVEDCTVAIRLDPRLAVMALGMRAEIKFRVEQDFDQAILDAEEAVKHDPNYKQ